jgi:hypothetical protein
MLRKEHMDIMYRREESRALYRAVARAVWERYRPGTLELPVGWTLLRDPGVSLRRKLRAAGVGLAAVAGVFGVQWALAWLTGIREPVAPPIVMLAEAAAALAIVSPIAMLRFADAEHVVRARLRRLAVIPLRRR